MHSDPPYLTLTGALENNISNNPDKIFIIHNNNSYTYSDVHLLSNGFADFLISAGIGKKDKVCLLLPRTPELIIAFFGIMKAGALPVPVNYTLSSKEVTNFITSSSPSLILLHEKLIHIPDIHGMTCKTVVIGNEHREYLNWKKICTPLKKSIHIETGMDDIAYLNYTTGSSGVPKGAVATHKNIYWNTVAAVKALKILSNDIHLCMFASFAHPHELFARAVYTGGTIVMLEEINPKTITKTVVKNSVTSMMGLAPMFDMMSRHCNDLSVESLRIAESGGMFTQGAIINSFKHRFGVPVLSVWGSTETSGIAIANTPESYRVDGSMGRPCPCYDVLVCDESGKEVGPGEIGELRFKGEGVVSRYFEDDTGFPLDDGWYVSGDLASRDEEGFFYFAERKSGLIKVAGLKVYPLQVENVLLTHKSVKEAAVIAMEDRLRGMTPKAFVVPIKGEESDPMEIQKFCRKKLADYMVPREIVFLDEMPKIGSGKIDKKALKEF